ncbi:MAG: DNA primase, partial [Ruminococcus callidus]
EADRRAYLRTRMFAVNRETANFYFRNLISGSDKRGLQYFISRQLKPETIKKYGLGYASDSWNALTDYLLQKGFTEEELLLANVAHRSNKGNLYDAFRGRVMFPIVDTRGAVIGFGGRVLDDSQPKYLNTAKTPVFDKGSNLFSLNFAKDSSSTIMILAEGYMDVIAINQAGFSNVVATLGTAITPEHARKLSRFAKEVVIAYDSDGPGQQATQKAINRLSEVGIATRILHMTGKVGRTSKNTAQSVSGCCWKALVMPSISGWTGAKRD